MSRKSKKIQCCANPMFLLWLEEWQKEAEERGLNSKWTYSKAIASIKKYPLPLRSGKEAKILENIGDGIAKKLDQKLADYLSSGGDYKDLHQANTHCLTHPTPKKRTKKSFSVDASITPSVSKTFDRKLKKYIPKFRSAPYALLLTMYEESQKPQFVGYMFKQELQGKAQHLCDKSFTLPEGNSHYTAWSSIGKLIEKGYMNKKGSPAKYFITETGCELAQVLLKYNNSQSSVLFPSKELSDSTTFCTQLHKVYEDNFPKQPKDFKTYVQSKEDIGGSLDTKLCATEELKYWYISENNEKTLSKSKALVAINELFGLGFLIKVKIFELEASGASFELDSSRPSEDGFHFAMIADKDCKDIAVPPPDYCESFVSSKKQEKIGDDERFTEAQLSSTLSRTNFESKQNKESKCYASSIKNDTLSFGSKTATTTKLDKVDLELEVTSIRSEAIMSSKCHISSTSDTLTKSSIISDNSVNTNINSMMKTKEILGAVCLPASKNFNEIVKSMLSTEPPLFCFKPGTFKIILCVDNSETLGSGKRKKELEDKLSKSGIHVDTRKLQLGDFLWIAKEITGLQRELVLDFIVERKRMDDLASSICDGRFKEQKFRLKNCGLLKLVYMVEAYGNAQHLPVPEQTLHQAITNTQVTDGFFIKETDSIFHSAEYLKIMTTQLTHLYKEKTLFAVRMDLIKEMKKHVSCEEILQCDQQYLFTFEEFSSQTDKNKVLLVKEIFAKHLMQIKGMSADRALAIVELYPTPSILVGAFENCSSEIEKENLISSIQYGTAQRKIGNALSKQVYFFYSHKNP